MSQRVASQRFRQRKLSTKQNLSVLREKDIEPLIDDDASRHMPKVETGVEKGEEIVSCLPNLALAAFVIIAHPFDIEQYPGRRRERSHHHLPRD